MGACEGGQGDGSDPFGRSDSGWDEGRVGTCQGSPEEVACLGVSRAGAFCCRVGGNPSQEERVGAFHTAAVGSADRGEG